LRSCSSGEEDEIETDVGAVVYVCRVRVDMDQSGDDVFEWRETAGDVGLKWRVSEELIAGAQSARGSGESKRVAQKSWRDKTVQRIKELSRNDLRE